MQRIIGLMSGTSVDGIDAVLVDISGTERDLAVDLIAFETYAYRPALRQQILAVCAGSPLSVEALATLDNAIAQAFAEAAIAIQAEQSLKADLIGSHGQTVFHRPPQAGQLGYSLQLGRGEVIARATGTKTASNFRAADIAVGGQGAPLVPKIDLCLLSHPTQWRCVQNLGGIGNVAVLPPLDSEPELGQGVRGWDTGPSNVLLDLAVSRFTQGQQTYDAGGQWAARGAICQPLVERWLHQPFFQQSPPKSTGRELFGPAYLQACLEDARAYQLGQADVLATLTELTAASIVQSYRQSLEAMPDRVLLCGGGSRNTYLRERIQVLLGDAIPVTTTDDAGVNADAKEAIAFAVLAHWRVLGIPGNLPSATGAAQSVLLGDIHTPWTASG
ncbi:anhydro-N-acetylmuramic acid kinase [Altericista sp. CCNU0014]|uniref:anhydro-N-acetylmuramic acid kinase n=1 Tax=Altericista sp. CCNU0014 TaxID=3082949 RepID=UPI00385070BD